MQEYTVSHALSLQFSFYRISKQQQVAPVIKQKKKESEKESKKRHLQVHCQRKKLSS